MKSLHIVLLCGIVSFILTSHASAMNPDAQKNTKSRLEIIQPSMPLPETPVSENENEDLDANDSLQNKKKQHQKQNKSLRAQIQKAHLQQINQEASAQSASPIASFVQPPARIANTGLTESEISLQLAKETTQKQNEELNRNIAALHDAIRSQIYENVATVLEDHQDVINEYNDQGQNAISLAIENNCPDIVRLLIRHGVDANQTCDMNPVDLVTKCDLVNMSINNSQAFNKTFLFKQNATIKKMIMEYQEWFNEFRRRK